MTVRAARALRALLLTVAVVLSVLAHHELTAGADTASVSAMATTQAALDAQPHAAVMPEVGAPHTPARQAAASQATTSQAMGCGGAPLCSAAGLAHPPVPAAPPTAAVLDAPTPARAHLHPLPPGTGPPEPGDSSSVLRI